VRPGSGEEVNSKMDLEEAGENIVDWNSYLRRGPNV
jgi:hypothetical protein